MDEFRKELLLKMYDQMYSDINRHILVVWQSIGTIIASLTIFSFAEKDVLSLDIAVTLILLLSTWLIAHIFDASYWYNRNLVIIANIERQFFDNSDLQTIHYYFGKHRESNKMINHLAIQLYFGICLVLINLIYHFNKIVFPFITQGSLTIKDWSIGIPYLFLVFSFCYLNYCRLDRNRAYQNFLKNSPGISVNTKRINYGSGDGVRKIKK